MPSIDYAAVIADLEEKANAMLEAAQTLRGLQPKVVVPPIKVAPKKTTLHADGEMKPISQAIRDAINGQRTAIQIADVVEPQYPNRVREATRANVSTQLSAWQKQGLIRKDEQGRIWMMEGCQ